jgi:hypothetical protein
MKKLTFLTAILLATTTFAQVPNYVPTNGLVGWWPFNGNANDESGNGNNGTVNGATLTSDRNGIANMAYSFDGVNDKISSINPNLNNVYSISFWYYLNTNDFQYPIGFGINNLNTSDAYKGYGIGYSSTAPPCLGLNSSKIFVYDAVSTCNTWLESTSISNIQIWQNIVITKINNLTKIYKNGVFDISSSNLSLQGINNLCFGARSDNFAFFNGKLDDIGIWNRALTQQEITNLYNGVYNLPVELTKFSATCSENTTNINWQTASENNSAYFEVFKSRDGEVWTSKTTTPAAGNSTSTIDYSFTDNNEASLVYYKLKQVDKDGKSKEYGPISANCNENTSLSISPNPTNSEFNLVGMENFGTITSIEIKDAAGKVVKVLDPTTTNFSCVGLKAGIYFLAVTSNKTERVIKIIKE